MVYVTTKIIFGSEEAVQARFAASPVSQTINTSFVERHNLTCRQCHGRLARTVLSFSKDLTWLEKQLWLILAYYHFVLPHDSLAIVCQNPNLREEQDHPRSGNPSLRRWRQV